MKKFLLGVGMLMAVGMFNGSLWADEAVVGPGKKVTLDYTLTVDKKAVETSVGKTPLTYTAGNHEIIPGLEQQLNGLRVGDQKTVQVAAKDAYGEVDPKAYKEFPVSSLPKGLKPQVGMVLEATAPDGSKFPAEVTEVKGDKMVLNFNHPLAGKDLTFNVKILKIE